MKVLLWSPKGAGLHYGGPGMAAYRMYSKAAPGRFEVTLAHGLSTQETYELFSAQHLIAKTDNGDYLSRWNFVRKALKWISIHSSEFDVFHGLQGFHPSVKPALEAHRRGLPAVLKLAAHKSDLSDKGGWKDLFGLPRRRRELVKQLSGLIAISELIAQELLSYGVPEAKIARIPNGVDTDQFYPSDAIERVRLRAELGWPDRPTVLFVGGITARKNPLILIEALHLLRKHSYECQVVFCGPEDDMSYVTRIKARVRELRLDERVIWIGFTRAMAQIYRAADLYILPSSSEGMPNAMLEAMASGLPSLGTPISGISDLIDDGSNGRLISLDAAAISQAINDYLQDPALATVHGMSARSTVMNRFSAAAVLDAHERLFIRIMSGGVAAE